MSKTPASSHRRGEARRSDGLIRQVFQTDGLRSRQGISTWYAGRSGLNEDVLDVQIREVDGESYEGGVRLSG